MFFVVLLLLLVTASPLRAQQDAKIDCKIWQAWNNEQKTLYLIGYADVVGIIGFGGAVGGKSPEEIKQMVSALWPQGYNLGKLGDELDKLCPTAPFQKMRISLVITELAIKAQRGK